MMFEALPIAAGKEAPWLQDRSWFVYLLPLTDCSAFKVGFSCNPLQRIYGFSRRYFERFDLHQGLLLRLEECQQARTIEALLKVELAAGRTDAPAWLPSAAGGHTEWFGAEQFAGARALLQATQCDHPASQLLVAFDVIHGELLRRCTAFESWAWRLAQQVCDARALRSAERASAASALRDWLAAYRCFDIALFADDLAVRQFVCAAGTQVTA
jgi:hypothetical protein